MTSSISLNPMATTNAAGSFSSSLAGYISGTYLDDPSVRHWLAGGVLASAESLPMWGGVGISESLSNASGAGPDLGGSISRAASLAALTGFSVFNQNHAAITTPQSPVPAAVSGGQVNFFRLGSKARIIVPVAPSLVSLQGGLVTQQVSWDFTSQQLIPYSATYSAVTITGATWASTSGGQATFTVGTNLTSNLDAGDIIDVSGVVSTGGTGIGYNGIFAVVSVTSTTVVVTLAGSSSPGTYSSGGSIAGGGGALPVSVLDLNIGGSMTPVYNSSTGFITWNRSGSAAVILI